MLMAIIHSHPDTKTTQRPLLFMLEMTKQIHNTGKVVTMDSCFCVTVGILALHDAGVFGQALIKTRGKFRPKHTLATKLASS